MDMNEGGSEKKPQKLSKRKAGENHLSAERGEIEKKIAAAAARGDVGSVKDGLSALCELGIERLSDTIWSNKDQGSQTLLMKMAQHGSLAGLQALWGWGDAESKNDLGWTAFMAAVKMGRVQCVEWLASRVNVGVISENTGETALHLAIESNNDKMVALVASLPGVDVNAANKAGERAFHTAMWRRPDMALLLVGICDAKLENAQGATPLVYAAAARSEALVAQLLPLSAANKKTEAGLTALMSAANTTQPKNMALLLTWPGLNVWDTDNRGWTALDYALRKSPKDPTSRDYSAELACLDMLQKIAPLDIAEAALARQGAESCPELFARLEAAKMRAAVSEGEDLNLSEEKVKSRAPGSCAARSSAADGAEPEPPEKAKPLRL